MQLSEIIKQAEQFARTDKGLAYHYLIALLRRANGQDEQGK